MTDTNGLSEWEGVRRIERYYKKLEHDLNKFKMELEADYSGITETLEKRRGLLHADFYNSILGSNEFNLDPLFEIFEDFTDEYSNIGTLTHTYSPYPLTQASRPSAGASSTRKYFRQSITFPSTSTRGRKRLHGTSTPTKRKRNSTTRTPSTNINNFYLTDSSHLILPSSDSDESSSSYLQSALSTTQDYFNTNSNSIEHQQHQLSFEDDFDQAANILTANYSGSSGQVDDRRYCFCNQMSYGEMIACDNPLCTREWFHYRCVNIQVAPKGKWYCSECLKQTAAITSQLSASTNKQTSISSSSQNTLSPPLA
ncbi:unnamed protein product [Didymodactylos carnosus]|uniref:PHD-type domain-containing protein n=1 Tax=Didymodactylos carnosus TaxID=1234261 RepID=A0A813TWY0_9BILA|nr:unnamed protein product [Didymodactylos carnosus]CAF3601677.1 unnamed protein product [Didymodactylos carnosus]